MPVKATSSYTAHPSTAIDPGRGQRRRQPTPTASPSTGVDLSTEDPKWLASATTKPDDTQRQCDIAK
eukprot:7685874-Pyramimonas_sp.AAC.1